MSQQDLRTRSEDLVGPMGSGTITLEGMRALEGPNVYHHRPVIVAMLRLGRLVGRTTAQEPEFVRRLIKLLPGLREHHCSRGHAGGFVQRLHEGTYFGHVTEHVALELQGLLGGTATYGKTIYAGEEGLYQVIVRYHSEAGMRYLLQVAVDLVNALLGERPFELEPRLEEARLIIESTSLGPSTRSIVEAAERRGIPWRRLDQDSLVQLGYGRRRRLVRAALTSLSSYLAVETASDKELTKSLLREAGLPVPSGRVVSSPEEAVAALGELGAPAVVKPVDSNQGKGVSLDVATVDDLLSAFDLAAQHSDRVLVEEQFEGNDFRILVVGGRVVAASERMPCHVVGDGQKTVAELIEEANLDPRRGDGHARPLTRIVVDDLMREHLARFGKSLDYVPELGERLFLRRSANLSSGGTARDVTDQLHPQVRRLCERAATTIGLDICGVDLVATAIDKPLRDGGIVELNASPGLRMHLAPTSGRSRPVAEAIVDTLYPPGSESRIPIVSVTGTNGKTTVARAIGHIFGRTGATVGMTTTDGIYVGGELTLAGDNTGPASARAVLADPTVDVAVLECARGGILRRGLGFDWSDVAVLTNIREDHIGQDGIESVEDLVWIKSLVAERVKDGGTLVLNADDPRVAALMDLPRLRRKRLDVVYTSVDPSNPLVTGHLSRGGTACLLEDGWVTELTGVSSSRRIVEAAAVPLTLGGTARFQLENCLSTVAACLALGLEPEQVAAGLRSFCSSIQNPGRVNLFRVGSGYVMLDYGHNTAAFAAAADLVSRWGRPTTAIVGVPGDRDDRVLKDAIRVCARGFERLVIREDRDLRGRKPGEVAEMLRWTALEETPDIRCRVVLDECDALEQELGFAFTGGVLVLFYEHLQPLLDLLARKGAVAVDGVADVA